MSKTDLTEDQKKELLLLARGTIAEYLHKSSIPLKESDDPALNEKNGAFVSIHKQGRLRGCIGTFTSEKPLLKTIQDMAISAATHDPRFPPMTGNELKDVDIEISVLTPMREIKDVTEIEVGRHGIYIVKGFARGVLLPQVATEYGWDREAFLQQTCLKAGLGPDQWKEEDTRIYVFEALVFGEKGNSDV